MANQSKCSRQTLKIYQHVFIFLATKNDRKQARGLLLSTKKEATLTERQLNFFLAFMPLQDYFQLALHQ